MKKELLNILILLCPIVTFGQGVVQDTVLNIYNNQSRIQAANSITLKPGFHIPVGNTVLITIGGVPRLASNPTARQNYIMTRTFRAPVKVSQLGSSRAIDKENQGIQYFDGLGRPLQTVQVMASPTYNDIVQYIEYDEFGREGVKYLPHVKNGAKDGSFKATAKAEQLAYYATSNTWDASVAKTSNPYAVTVFEKSPLNRVHEQGAPGAQWQPSATPGAGHTVKTSYGANTASGPDMVRLWTVTPTGATGTTDYGAGKLYRTTLRDENSTNTTSRAGSVDEYKDFEDRVVLKRVWESETKKLDTYYIYDDFGDLRYVVPPAVIATSFTDADANFTNYIYGYKYDVRKRLIEKKVPGKGWEYLIYNKSDQLVLTQDALQRGRKEWIYIRYDAFGRITSTGLYINTGVLALADMQGIVDADTGPLWEARSGIDYPAAYAPFPRVGTGITIIPNITNYYDDYGFADASSFPPAGITQSNMTHSLQTGVKVYKDDGTLPLLTVNYYDDYGRVIQSISQNHVGGSDRTTNTYSFVGELLTSTRVHTPATGAATTITTTNTYDHVGRLVETKKRMGTQAEIVQSQLVYNEIGQLKQKNLGGSGGAAVQEIVYAYNERGWMTGINDPNSITDKRRFGMALHYANNPRAYNGNIGSVQWNTKVSGLVPTTQTPVQSYAYTYDALNRLKKAAYAGATGKADHYNEELAYDVMGNIDTLRRSNGASGWYNHFKYTYSGHRLSSVADAGSATRHNSFTYDVNGNAISNTRLGISKIDYNYLNLPSQLTKGGEVLVYTYDATGKKLTKQLGTAVATHYVDGIQYKGGAIEFIQTEEGRILPNGSSYIYEYFLKDHLGNTRAIVDHTGAVKQVQDYYAFGMEMNPGNAYSSAPINLYRYNGKEKQTELGLDQLDYGARFYDAEIGRWNVVDPLAKHPKQVGTSPYAYAANNPIRYIDPTGMIWEDPKEAKKLNKSINSRIKSLDKNSEKIQAQIDKGGLSEKKLAKLEDKLADNGEKVRLLNQSLADIEAIGNAAETYKLTGPSANDGTHGIVKGADGVIKIEGSNTGLHIHEIRHVGQSIEAGGVKFNKNGRLLNAATTFLGARNNEVNAYRTQYSFDGSYPVGASSLKDINEKSLMQIKIEGGTKVYKDLEDRKK